MRLLKKEMNESSYYWYDVYLQLDAADPSYDPTMPAVQQGTRHELAAYWSATDPESYVKEYKVRVFHKYGPFLQMLTLSLNIDIFFKI